MASGDLRDGPSPHDDGREHVNLGLSSLGVLTDFGVRDGGHPGWLLGLIREGLRGLAEGFRVIFGLRLIWKGDFLDLRAI